MNTGKESSAYHTVMRKNSITRKLILIINICVILLLIGSMALMMRLFRTSFHKLSFIIASQTLQRQLLSVNAFFKEKSFVLETLAKDKDISYIASQTPHKRFYSCGGFNTPTLAS